MHAFFDTEFIQLRGRLTFVSIAIVRSDGREMHRVADNFDPDDAGWFFKKKVWPSIKDEPRTPIAEIAAEVREFLNHVTLIACRCSGQDKRLLEELIGSSLWMEYHNLQTRWEWMGKPQLPAKVKTHHALDDARWHQTMYLALENISSALTTDKAELCFC